MAGLNELKERCEQAVVRLNETLDGHLARGGLMGDRLAGKIEGIELVLSYINEMQRGDHD